MSKKPQDGLATLAIHAGEKTIERSVTQPIFQSSTYIFEEETQYVDVKYGRLSNTPNHQTLAEKIAALEKMESGLVTASGMAAITTTLLACVEPEGHLLAQDQLYGGTYYFLKDDFSKWNRKVSLFSVGESSNLEKYFQSNTQAVYVETISNPTLQIPDLEKVVEVAHRRGAIAIIDNTFASPVNFNPADLGFDIVLHSATKYLNGHTDVLAGAVASRSRQIEKIRKMICHLGPSLDPHACFLLNRGLKTLVLRVQQHNKNAQALALGLQNLSRVKKVYYPGLENHPNHSWAVKYFKGFGGMLSFDFNGTVNELEKALKKLRLPFVAPSLGGVETLITRPSTTSHSGIPATERSRLGIHDTLVRVSVGLEDINDLISDFEQAFSV